MINQNSRYVVLTPDETAVEASGAFLAQLDRSHFLVDCHTRGLHFQRVVNPADMRRMFVFPNDAAYNSFIVQKFAPPGPPKEDDFELFSDFDSQLPESRVDEVGNETVASETGDLDVNESGRNLPG